MKFGWGDENAVMNRIFVYGTLKRGESNHGWLMGQRFAGLAMTRPVYRMYDAGGYPGLVKDVENGVSIQGEVWEVDAECLARLDELEDVAGGEYVREAVELVAPFDAGDVQAYRWQRPIQGLRDVGACW